MNPEILATATPGLMTEGCLSLPDVRVTIPRPERIRVLGYDGRGQRRCCTATGLWARVIQHELDHLNGVLILDYGPPTVEALRLTVSAPPASLMAERPGGTSPQPVEVSA
jgi:peptide deformylase